MQSRIAKTLARGAVVSWREQPTQYDIEALRSNVERVRLVIRVRWAIVAVLAIFSVVGATVYATSTDLDALVSNMTIPAIALLFVLMYNGFYQAILPRMANVAFLNQAQLLFDMVVATVLVYYSGGVYSWFSTMYLFFILEAAFILPRRSQVWSLIISASLLYGSVLLADFAGWIPHVELPLVMSGLQDDSTYVLVRYLWQVTLFSGAGLVGMLMMKSIRVREAELREASFIDDLTGLYNRHYFQRVLRTECERAMRNNRQVALILADIDRFGEVNRTFGVEVGDEILATIARHLRQIASADTGIDGWDVNTACRIGGEELALIVPEVARGIGDRTPLEHRAYAVAETFRQAVESTRVSGVSVTVSVGVVFLPTDGTNSDTLLDAADGMLSLAVLVGGNAVRSSSGAIGSADDDGQR